MEDAVVGLWGIRTTNAFPSLATWRLVATARSWWIMEEGEFLMMKMTSVGNWSWLVPCLLPAVTRPRLVVFEVGCLASCVVLTTNYYGRSTNVIWVHYCSVSANWTILFSFSVSWLILPQWCLSYESSRQVVLTELSPCNLQRFISVNISIIFLLH